MAPAVRYGATQLDWGTHFTYGPEVAAMLIRFAGVRPGSRLVELGCGTGFWGLLLAKGLRGRGSLLATDCDPALVRTARLRARAMGTTIARFRTADGGSTGLPAASADIVTCHRLLCVVRDPETILREMIRIARPGGIVVANEHTISYSVYRDPHDPSAASLVRRRNAAFKRGARLRHGMDHDIGVRLPELFIAAGLRDVRMEVLLAPVGPQPFDGRLDATEVTAFFDWTERGLPMRGARTPIQKAGGLAATDEQRFVSRTRAAIGRARAAGLSTWPVISLLPRFVVRGTVPT